MDIKQVLEEETDRVKEILPKDKKTVLNYVIFENDGKKVMLFLLLEREQTKKILDMITDTKPNYLIVVNEGYMKTAKKMDYNYVHGQLEREFKQNEKSVRETINIQIYMKHGKIMRILDRNTLKTIHDTEEFDGFLTVSDIKRVFWKGE